MRCIHVLLFSRIYAQYPTNIYLTDQLPKLYNDCMRQSNFWLDEQDRLAIRAIRQMYGCESDAQAVRLALRALARHPEMALTLPERPKHASSGKEQEEHGTGEER